MFTAISKGHKFATTDLKTRKKVNIDLATALQRKATRKHIVKSGLAVLLKNYF